MQTTVLQDFISHVRITWFTLVRCFPGLGALYRTAPKTWHFSLRGDLHKAHLYKWILRLLGLLVSQTKPLHVGSYMAAVVLKSKLVPLGYISEACDNSSWCSPDRQNVVPRKGVSMLPSARELRVSSVLGYSGRTLTLCLAIILWHAALTQSGEDAHTVYCGFLAAKAVFPALSRPANEAPLTPDRPCLPRCGKKQRERENKASFWEQENFWNINLVNNSLPAEFHLTADLNRVTDGIVFQSVSKTQGSTCGHALLFLIQHNNTPGKDRACNNCSSGKKNNNTSLKLEYLVCRRRIALFAQRSSEDGLAR